MRPLFLSDCGMPWLKQFETQCDGWGHSGVDDHAAVASRCLRLACIFSRTASQVVAMLGSA